MNSASELNKEKIVSNKTESKDLLENLKSDYFLQKIFNYLLEKKSLQIIKYNKNLKNRINISIYDYRRYSSIYSSIEIEIKLIQNKYGNYINIDENNEEYYHIYLDNNKEETEIMCLYQNDDVEKLKIIIDYQIKSFQGLFEDCKDIEYIYFKKFYRNNINNMGHMFFGCSSLKELNLSNFNTDNVTDMHCMFYYCLTLEKLNISNFNVSNATNMEEMFKGCESLSQLNISNFIFNNKSNINGMIKNSPIDLKIKILKQFQIL